MPPFSIISKTSCSTFPIGSIVPPTFFSRDLENPLLGLVEDDFRLLVGSIGIAEDVVAGGDQLPKHRLFAHDPRVVHSVGSRRDGVEDLRDIRCAPDFLQKLPLAQFLEQNDRVDRPVHLVQLHEHVEDDLVIGLIERVAVDHSNDFADHLFFEHHRGQEAHFGFDGMGRKTVELAGQTGINQLAHRRPPFLFFSGRKSC